MGWFVKLGFRQILVVVLGVPISTNTRQLKLKANNLLEELNKGKQEEQFRIMQEHNRKDSKTLTTCSLGNGKVLAPKRSSDTNLIRG